VHATHLHPRRALAALAALALALAAIAFVMAFAGSDVTLGGSGELGVRALLDLPHALGTEAQAVADRAQPLALAVEPVAGPQDLAFAVRQTGQQCQQLLAGDRVEHALVGVTGRRVGEQLAEAAQPAILVLHGLVERARAALGGQEVVDLVGGQAGALDEVVARRTSSALAHRLGVRLLQPGEVAQRAVRQHGRAGELGHELLHRLAHPPRGIAPERHAAIGVEALERAQQPDDPLLQQFDALDGPGRCDTSAPPTR
jgi:hypothetical protein